MTWDPGAPSTRRTNVVTTDGTSPPVHGPHRGDRADDSGAATITISPSDAGRRQSFVVRIQSCFATRRPRRPSVADQGLVVERAEACRTLVTRRPQGDSWGRSRGPCGHGGHSQALFLRPAGAPLNTHHTRTQTCREMPRRRRARKASEARRQPNMWGTSDSRRSEDRSMQSRRRQPSGPTHSGFGRSSEARPPSVRDRLGADLGCRIPAPQVLHMDAFMHQRLGQLFLAFEGAPTWVRRVG